MAGRGGASQPPPAARSLERRIDYRCLQGDGRRSSASSYGFLSERRGFARALAMPASPSSGAPARSNDGRQGQIEEAGKGGRRQRRPRLSPARSPTRTKAVRIASEIVSGHDEGLGRQRRQGMRLAGERTYAKGSMRPSAGWRVSATTGCSSKFIEEPRHRDPGARRSARQHPLSRRARMFDQRRHQNRRGRVALRHAEDAQGDGRAGGRARRRSAIFGRRGRADRLGADKTGAGYFLEMNTASGRYPVTEEVMASPWSAGDPRRRRQARFLQKDVKLDGWSIETRVMPPIAASCPRPAGWSATGRRRSRRESGSTTASSRAARFRCSTIR